MKRGLLAIAAMALAVLVPSAVSSAMQQQGNGPPDSAVGTAQSGDMRVAFAAHGSGADVTGHFRAGGSVAGLGSDDPTEFQFEGPVTCLDVRGNRAGLFYPIKQAKPDTFEDSGVFIFLEDNGRPDNGESPDKIGFAGPVPFPNDDAPPPLCPPLDTPMDVEKGDFTIREGTP